jgi:hypothetical protein
VIVSCRSFSTLQQWRKDLGWGLTAVSLKHVLRELLPNTGHSALAALAAKAGWRSLNRKYLQWLNLKPVVTQIGRQHLAE